MSWETIDLTSVSTALEIIPEKTFTFELLPGAKYDERDPNRISCQAAIVQDGEFTGRRIFFSYPDPSVKEWSPKALKRLEQAIGIDIERGEDPVTYLNRVAGNHFMTNVTHSKPTDEYPNPRANLNLFNVKPAA